MTVFGLSTFICVTILSLNGDLVSKACHWGATGGALFQNEDTCAAKGKALVGTKVHSFSITVGEDRRIENFKCNPLHVE